MLEAKIYINNKRLYLPLIEDFKEPIKSISILELDCQTEVLNDLLEIILKQTSVEIESLEFR